MRASERLWICRWGTEINWWDDLVDRRTHPKLWLLLAALEAQEAAPHATGRSSGMAADAPGRTRPPSGASHQEGAGQSSTPSGTSAEGEPGF